MKDIGGTERLVPYAGDHWYWDATGIHLFSAGVAEGLDSQGLVVGAGDAAEDFDGYALDSQITHGGGAGQLGYGATLYAPPTSHGDHAEISFTRDFTNSTADPVAVRELGFYVRSSYAEYGHDYLTAYFMVLRDVLLEPLSVAPTRAVRVKLLLRAYL